MTVLLAKNDTTDGHNAAKQSEDQKIKVTRSAVKASAEVLLLDQSQHTLCQVLRIRVRREQFACEDCDAECGQRQLLMYHEVRHHVVIM